MGPSKIPKMSLWVLKIFSYYKYRAHGVFKGVELHRKICTWGLNGFCTLGHPRYPECKLFKSENSESMKS